MLDHTIEIQFDADAFIKNYLERNTRVLIPYIDHELKTISGIDLSALPTKPTNLRLIFLKWLLYVNRDRLKLGKDLHISYELLKQCPLWAVFPMPFRQLKLTKESLGATTNAKPMIGTSGTTGTVGTTPSVGTGPMSINKKKMKTINGRKKH
jgi:hypothetical protein